MATNKIHMIWIGGPVPTEVMQNVDIWRNKNNNDVQLWTDKDLEKFGRGFWSDEKLHPVQRADFLRLEILYRYGGWYIDADCRPGDLELQTDSTKVQLAFQDYFLISNGFLSSPKLHPFIKFFQEKISENFVNHSHSDISRTSGPYALRSALNSYLMLSGEKKFNDEIVILPRNSFVFIPSHLLPIRINDLKKNALAVHHSPSSWNQIRSSRYFFRRMKSVYYFGRMTWQSNILERIRNTAILLKNIKKIPVDFRIVYQLTLLDIPSYFENNKFSRKICSIDNLEEFRALQGSQFKDIIRIKNQELEESILNAGWKKMGRIKPIYIRKRLDRLSQE